MSEQIPREFIDQLLNRIDIVDLIDGRIPLKKKTGANFFACCPFHNEKSPSFSVSQVKQFYYCFGCGAHGNAIDFLIQYDRLSFPETIETLARQAGLEVPKVATIKSHNPQQKNLYDLMDQVNKYYQAQLRQHGHALRVIDYLKQRGVSGEMAKLFEIGFAPSGWEQLLSQFPQQQNALLDAGLLIRKEDNSFYDRFRDRIMFPIRDRRGRVVGFGGRIIDKGEPKYLNSPETPIFQKGHELYGLYQTLQANHKLERIIVVEGYMDVIALYQHGITNAVATLGTATTPHHIERLFKHAAEVIFCFDGDNAGKSAAWRALQVTLPLMRDGIQIRFLFLPDGDDPDSLVRKEGMAGFNERIQSALTIADYFFQTLAAQADISSPDGRARFIKLATDLLKTLPAGFFQQLMLEELAKRARVLVSQLPGGASVGAVKKPVNLLKAKPPSALRLAMTLLLQQPSLVRVLGELPKLDLPGFELFAAIVEEAKRNPEQTTAGLLEHWRDQADGKILAKLAAVEHMIPEAGVSLEFEAAVKKLHEAAQGQMIEGLLAKAAQGALSSEEKQNLQLLISSKK